MSSLVGIILVFALHLTVFSPQAQDYKEAKTEHDDMVAQIRQLKRVRPSTPGAPDRLTEYEQNTQQFLDELQEGISELGLDYPEEFVMPQPQAIQVDAPEGTPPEQIEQMRSEKFTQQLVAKINEQIDLLLSEVEELAGYRNRSDVQMNFLGPQGWGLPTELPAEMQSAQLWDMLKAAYETKGMLEKLSPDTAYYSNWQNRYDRILLAVGLNPQRAEYLKRFGEFVPLYYKAQVLNLISDRMPEGAPRYIMQEQLDRDMLIDLLGIQMPNEPIEGTSETRLYFAEEELRHLNDLLALSLEDEFKLSQINQVVLWGYGYLREIPEGMPQPGMDFVTPDNLPSDEPLLTEQPRGTREPAYTRQVGVAPQAEPDEEPKAPQPQDIGFAMPIKLNFRATNINAWSYIYEVLRRNPMYELHRLELSALPRQIDPDSKMLDVEATFIAVPKLFETIEQIRGILDELQTQQTEAPPTAAPAGG